MAEGDKKFERTQKLREALKNKPKTPDPMPKISPNPKVAAAATQKPKRRKFNYRTAKARDERAKSRGRMPINTQFEAKWDGVRLNGELSVWTVPPGIENYKGGDIVNDKEYEEAVRPKLVKGFIHQADGLFRLMEELDIMFWDWYTREATDEQKKLLIFAPDPPAPAPWEFPPSSEGTATEPH